MGLFGKKDRKPKIRDVIANYVEGLDYPEGLTVLLWARIENLVIRAFQDSKKYNQYILEYDQIVGVTTASESQIVEAQKSVVGRAVIGGVLLGGLGATIGAISGVGTKQKQNTDHYIIINYITSESNDAKAMSFKCIPGSQFYGKFVDELRFRAGLLAVDDGKEPPSTIKL